VSFLEQSMQDGQEILEKEQAALAEMPRGFSEVNLQERVRKLDKALGLMEDAHQTLSDVAFEEAQYIEATRPR
jgi:hypothetical protein